jgi:hypothetical protein
MRRLTISIALMLAAILVSVPGFAQQDVITTVIGGGPNSIPAIDANLYNPQGVAVDSAGNVYIAAFNQNRVFKVATSGTLTVFAGIGVQGYTGDAGQAAAAELYHPYALAVDTANNVYIADQYNCVVRKVASNGIITTIAGTAGSCTYAGDGGKGILASLYYPSGLALDASGNLFIGDNNNCVVRRLILASDVISTYAGSHSCGFNGDGGQATAAQLSTTTGLAADSAGNLFIADSGNCVVREVTVANKKISTVAGNHTCGFNGDGGAATSAEMNQEFGIAVNAAGTTVTFSDYYNQRIRQFTVGGNIKTIAGNGTACAGINCGVGGVATSAELYYPIGVAISSANKIYIGNNDNYDVVSFTSGGNLSLFAGNYSYNIETQINGTPALGAELNNPYGIDSDSAGNVYVNDSSNFRVRELVKSTNLLNLFAGNGTNAYLGDGGPAANAELSNNYGVAKDSTGNVYIADTNNCVVRQVSPAGTISLFAGLVISGSIRCGYSGDGGSATASELYRPYGVAVDNKGSVYIADYQEHVVRKVTAGVINTIAGIGGLAGYSGDGGPATAALLNGPVALAVDTAGNVFIDEYANCRIREINASTGIISTVAGNGLCSYSGDGLATANAIQYPQGITVDANDNLFISDGTNRIRWVSPSGYMTTIAGTGAANYTGDGILATSATLNEPTGITLDPAGNILVSDYNNGRVRSISAFSALSTSTSSLAFGLTSVGSTSSPLTLLLSAFGPVTLSNIAISTNYSEADNCPTSMTNGTTCSMYVYFVPTGAGALNGNLTVNTNGFFSQTNTVNLTGLGSAISLSGSPLSFGNQLVKTTSAAKVVTVKNNGTTPIKMGTITLTNTTDYSISANTCPASAASLAGGASCAISVKFGPKSTGAKRGTVVINDNDPSTPQLIGLSGTGISNVALSPATISFPTTPVTVTSAASKITLTNNTGASITLSATPVTVTGPFVNSPTTTCTADLVIANSGTCVVNVQFKPTAVGFASGTVSVADSDVTTPQSVAVQGYGTAVKFTPGSVNFGTVTRGVQVSSTVTITNVGTTNVFFAGAELTGPNSADFVVNYADNAPCNNTAANPLLPGKTCQITVYFDPTKVGAENVNYKVFDNSVGSPHILPMTGRGQ